jgi:lipid A ethanolaminephosphotransferase
MTRTQPEPANAAPPARRRVTLSLTQLILLSAFCFIAFYNFAFFRNSYAAFGGTASGWAFLASLALFCFAVTVLLLGLLCFAWTAKPVLIFLVLSAASASYFMNRFNIVVDTTMLANVIKTDTREVADLMNVQFLGQMLLLGALPIALLALARIQKRGLRAELLSRLKLLGGALGLIVLCVAPFTSHYTSFMRQHKLLRYYTNPATPLYSGILFAQETLAGPITAVQRKPMGQDAHIPADDMGRALIVLVVGEAARADHFSLNGYARETNPLLRREDVISFAEVTSCGTSTAYSLPCMFSLLGRRDFSPSAAKVQENVLDVLTHAGIHVLWRDNNSDSKGVAVGVPFEDFRNPERNPVCDVECRDVGMLAGLDEYIAARPKGDIVIVLHQMGNHGPAYYKRYPAEFEVFKPACQSAELTACTDEEITNAYDNALRYTDYFLTQVIAFLRRHDDQFKTAMYYMADHGESLGENGIYLHGLPWLLAPKAQKNPGSVMWFGQRYHHVDRDRLKARAREPLSHDNYAHTVMGLVELQTEVFDPSKSLLE